MKLYLDTSIWRDYYENRADKFRPLGEWAFALLKKAVDEDIGIMYSDFVLEELRKSYSDGEIEKIFGIIDNTILFKASISNKQAEEAAKICKERKVAFGDALHAVIAKDNEAILVTRDRHFEELRDVVDVRKPEELI